MTTLFALQKPLWFVLAALVSPALSRSKPIAWISIVALTLGTCWQLSCVVISTLRIRRFRAACARLTKPGTPDTVVPPVPPPNVKGYCWLREVFPTATTVESIFFSPDLDDYDVETTEQPLDPFLLELWECNRGWITNFQLASYLRIMEIDKFVRMLPIDEYTWHVTDESPLFFSPDDLEDLPACWIGMDTDFFNESAVRNSILSLHMGDYSKALQHGKKFTPYEVPPHMYRYLKRAGLPLPPPHAIPHTHGIHFALRNLNRFQAARALRNVDWYALWLRAEDEAYFTSDANVKPPVGYWDPGYQAKDILRFGLSPPPTTQAPSSPAPVWYIDDALHMLSATTVGSWFDTHDTLQMLVATIVVPPETIFGLQAQTPELYDFRIVDDSLIYVPEKDQPGAYVQPLSAHHWLTDTTLVTPNNEALHVGLVFQQYAHATIVISRKRLLPDQFRVMDMPDLKLIPWFAHPTGSIEDRITSPELLRDLPSYATRVGTTNLKDLYAKIAQYMAKDYKHLPPSWSRAAALYAQSTHMLDHCGTMSFWDTLSMRLSYATNLPFATVKLIYQSYTSRLYGNRMEVRDIWLAKPTTTTARKTDFVLPGAISGNTEPVPLDLYYIPPSDTWRASWALANASFLVAAAGKLVFVALFHWFRHHYQEFPGWIDGFTFLLNASWQDTPTGLMIAALVFWAGFRTPKLYVAPVHVRAWRWIKWFYGCIFFLPTAGLNAPAGLHVGYQLAITLLAFVANFPRTMPWYFAHQWREQNEWVPIIRTVRNDTYDIQTLLHKPATHNVTVGYKHVYDPHTSAIMYWTPVLSLFIGCLIGGGTYWYCNQWHERPLRWGDDRRAWRFNFGYWIFRSHGLFSPSLNEWSAGDSPGHGDFGNAPREYEDDRRVPGAYPGPNWHWGNPNSSSPPPPPPPPPPSGPTPPPPPPPPSSDDSSPSDSSRLPPNPYDYGFWDEEPLPVLDGTDAEFPEGDEEVTGPNDFPDDYPGRTDAPVDLNAAYYPPSQFDDFTHWQRLVNQTRPTTDADPAFYCVWYCLATVLGVTIDGVYHTWLRHCQDVGKTTPANGAVLHTDLARVFAHFRVGATIYHANGTADTQPHGADLPEYNPQEAPFLRQTASPTWPSHNFFLAGTAGGAFHLTLYARPNRGAIPPLPNALSMIGLSSTITPRSDIAQVVNFPMKSWVSYYSRLNGTLPNIAAANEPSLRGIVSRRNTLVALPLVPVQADTTTYTFTNTDLENALHLARDMKSHPECLELHDENPRQVAVGAYQMAKSVLAQTNAGRPHSVRFHVLAGLGGTGKSTALKTFLRTIEPPGGYNSVNLRFLAWDNTLRKQLEADMSPLFPGLLPQNFATKCVPFAVPSGGVLVADDGIKCWNGYFPLLSAFSQSLTDIVITCDSTQASTVFPHADSDSRSAPSTASFLQPLIRNYGTNVFRYSDEIKELFGLPIDPTVPNLRRGSVYVVTRAPAGVPMLVVSPRFAETLNNGGVYCMTWNTCQGITVDGDIAIDLGGLSSTATDTVAWTALTRATGNIFLVLGASMGQPSTISPTGFGTSQILSAMLSVSARFGVTRLTAANDPDRLIARAVQNHISRCTSPLTRQNLNLGPAAPIVGSYVRDPYRRAFIDRVSRTGGDHFTARTMRSIMTKGSTTHAPAFSSLQPRHNHQDRLSTVRMLLRHLYPVTNDNVLTLSSSTYRLPSLTPLEGQYDPLHDHVDFVNADTRELKAPGYRWSTTQHIHDGPHAWLHHLGRDKATQVVSEKKRINIGRAKYPLTSKDRSRHRQLRKGLLKFFDVGKMHADNFRPDLFERAAQYVLAPWVSKRTVAQMVASLEKNDLDQRRDQIRLFLKQQFVKKEEKRYSRATAGQTVSEFGLSKQFEDAIQALYVEFVVLEAAYPTTYLHCRANPDDMSRWYISHWRPGPMTANDYTAWDSGCDEPFVELAVDIMHLTGVCRAYTDRYRHDRLHSSSHLGPHRPRQESGDRWTWLVNTLCNAALTGASLNCPARTPAAFSGDDGTVLGQWRHQGNFRPDDWVMTAKRVVARHTEFCGYLFGDADVRLSPLVVLHRAQAGFALGRNDREFWDSIYNSHLESSVGTPPYDTHLVATRHMYDLAIRAFNLPSRY